MSDQDQKKPKVPYRMSRISFPNAKLGLYLAIMIVVVIVFILYKDLIL